MKWMRWRKDLYRFVEPGMVIQFWGQEYDTWRVTRVVSRNKESMQAVLDIHNVMNGSECLDYPMYFDSNIYRYARPTTEFQLSSKPTRPIMFRKAGFPSAFSFCRPLS